MAKCPNCDREWSGYHGPAALKKHVQDQHRKYRDENKEWQTSVVCTIEGCNAFERTQRLMNRHMEFWHSMWRDRDGTYKGSGVPASNVTNFARMKLV